MGVLQIPVDETEIMSEVESFIDENGKIDIEDMKNKGYDDNRIYGMLHEYYIATAKILADYRKNRINQSPYKFFLHHKVQYVDENKDFSRDDRVLVYKVKSSYKHNGDVYNKLEEALQKSKTELFPVRERNFRHKRNDKIRYSSSAIELSPSKYFRSFSPDIFVRKTRSCHNVRCKIEKIEPNTEADIVFRTPTPFHCFAFQSSGQPIKSSSYAAEIVNGDDVMSEVKHVHLSRGNIPSIAVCPSHVHLKKEPTSDIPDDNGHVTKVADESSEESLSVISDSSSLIGGGLQDYVKVNVEKTFEMYDLYDSLESNCVSQTTNSSCIEPPPPSVNSETFNCKSDTTIKKSETSISELESTITGSDTFLSKSDIIFTQSESTTNQSDIYDTQSETTITQTDVATLSHTDSQPFPHIEKQTSPSMCVTKNQYIITVETCIAVSTTTNVDSISDDVQLNDE